MWNAGLDDSQAGIKFAGRTVNNLRYADDTTLLAKSKELKNLLMRVKESEKAGLKLNIHKAKIVACSPITSWQIDGEKVETVTYFSFFGSKITANSDYSQEIKTCFLLGRKLKTNLDSILKSRDITLPTKVHLGYGFPSSHVWMWELDYSKGWVPGIDAFELWCWRLLKVPWIARRSN